MSARGPGATRARRALRQHRIHRHGHACIRSRYAIAILSLSVERCRTPLLTISAQAYKHHSGVSVAPDGVSGVCPQALHVALSPHLPLPTSVHVTLVAACISHQHPIRSGRRRCTMRPTCRTARDQAACALGAAAAADSLRSSSSAA